MPPWYARELAPSHGWPYFMYQALLDMGAVSTLVAPSSSPALAVRLANAFSEISRRRFDILREPSLVRRLSSQLAREASRIGARTIVAADSTLAAYLPGNLHLVLWLDATFERLCELYPEYARVATRTLKNGHRLEASALERADLVIYSSEWARESANRFYDLPTKRTTVIPWGANLPDVPAPEDVSALIEARADRRCTLLFIGLDWERKGGPLAVEIVTHMRKAGIDAELSVVVAGPTSGAGRPRTSASWDFSTRPSRRNSIASSLNSPALGSCCCRHELIARPPRSLKPERSQCRHWSAA